MSRKLIFRDASGAEYQPVRSLNRATGVSAYRVKPKGASNEASDAMELETIEDLAKAMIVGGLPARVQAVSGGPVNYLKIGAQKLSTYELDPEIADRIGVPPTSSSFTQADRICQFVIENFVDPARSRGERELELVAGDVHSAMGLSNALPVICEVLEAPTFETQAQVQLLERHCPIGSDKPSSTIRYRFALICVTSSLDPGALKGLKQRFLLKHPDFKSFADCGSFAAGEGDYKRALVAEAQKLFAESVQQSDEALGAALLELLAGRAGLQSNLVDWRAQKVIDQARQAQPGLVETAAGVMARANESAEAVIAFVDKVWPALSAGLPSKPYAESRMVSTMLRALVWPQDMLPIRSTPTENASRMLAGKPAFANMPLSKAELDAVLDWAHELRRVMEEEWQWRPRDLWDVQGFIWETCQKRLSMSGELDPTPVWFVTARWGEEDGLPRFIQREEWSLLPELGVTNVNNERVSEMRKGDFIVARDYFHQSHGLPFDANGKRISALRIRAIGRVKEESGDQLRVGVEWEDELDPPRTWYFYTHTAPVWRLTDPGEKSLADHLRRFVLDGEDQDYDLFLNDPNWRVRLYGDSYSERLTPMDPTNLILYGPPGTGKTYRTAAEAVRLCGGHVPENRDELMEAYNALSRDGRIRFVTFHQNFSYEEFVEGLRPETGDGEEEGSSSAGFRLQPTPGIFRELCAVAEEARKRPSGSAGSFDLAGRRFWKMSLGRVGQQDSVYESALEDGHISLGYGGDIDWSDSRFSTLDAIRQEWESVPREDDRPSNYRQLHPFRNEIKVGDIVIVPASNKSFRAIGEVVGEYYFEREGEPTYYHRRKVSWLAVPDEPLPLDTIIDGDFMMRSLYSIADRRVNKDALSRLIGQNAGSSSENGSDGETQQFVLIIDEINRANISKVFGELITLIEPDKRLGMANALKVRLPYSKREFGVPANLHILGTMNTADRSIALLDTALRRRFRFEEMTPDTNVEAFRAAEEATGLPLAAVLNTINRRIEYLVDRDHRIGHAFFIGCETKALVDAAMRDKVIPLLQEYFFDDWNRLAAVLGEKDKGGNFLACETIEDPMSEGGEPLKSWRVRGQFDEGAYSRLVTPVAASVEGASDEGKEVA